MFCFSRFALSFKPFRFRGLENGVDPRDVFFRGPPSVVPFGCCFSFSQSWEIASHLRESQRRSFVAGNSHLAF